MKGTPNVNKPVDKEKQMGKTSEKLSQHTKELFPKTEKKNKDEKDDKNND